MSTTIQAPSFHFITRKERQDGRYYAMNDERRDWICDAPIEAVFEALDQCGEREFRDMACNFDSAAKVAAMNGEHENNRRWRYAYHIVEARWRWSNKGFPT